MTKTKSVSVDDTELLSTHWWMIEKKRVVNAKLKAWCYLKGLKSIPEFVQADLVLVSLLLEALQLKNVIIIIITKCAKCPDIS